jgi:hypothetical protein
MNIEVRAEVIGSIVKAAIEANLVSDTAEIVDLINKLKEAL